MNTLNELLISRGEIKDKGITFVINDTDERFLSYHDLYHSSLWLLYQLQQRNLKPGEEVVFQIDDNEKFIIVFWACILGGFIPVPISVGQHDEQRLKLFRIWNILQKPRLITTRDVFQKISVFASQADIPVEVFEGNVIILDELPESFQNGLIHPAKEDDIAFIQFSSGSTGEPKGAIITHKNVLLNLTAVLRRAKITPADSGLNWMPLTHDMGLIGTHIKGLLAGIRQYNMPTSLFIKHPTLWIEKASQRRVTLLYSPNFGYKHFLKFLTPEIKRDWDLSNIRLIFNGAEPISLELCQEFLTTLKTYGLHKNSMYPVYGLAEGTIAVTFPEPGSEMAFIHLSRNSLGIGDSIRITGADDPSSITFVEVGTPLDYCQLRIGDEKGLDIGEDRIGYIQIRGGNVTSGYYRNPQATRQLTGAGGWLNTGDLGFLHQGKLYVTGRAKDVIFIAGQNYYSHDIERIAEAAPGLELGKVAAVGVFNRQQRGDQLVLFILFKSKLAKFLPLIPELKRLVNRQLGIEVAEVIPVKSMPKTTSGKIQRYRLRERYLNGEFDDLRNEINALQAKGAAETAGFLGSATETKLAQIWSEILSQTRVKKDDDFFALGGDSLRATQMLSRIYDSFGIRLELEILFENPQLAKLASLIDQIKPDAGDALAVSRIMDPEVNRYPLSYAQQRLWFLDQLHHGSPQYNLSSGFRFKGSLNPAALENSFKELFKRHAILRVSFHEKDGQPFQEVHPELELKLPLIDLRDLPPTEGESQALQRIREMANQGFSLNEAPLFRMALFQLGDSEFILGLAAHHLIFDGWSFGILLKELAFFYEKFTETDPGETPGRQLPGLPIQYFDYAQWQRERLARNDLADQGKYWKRQLSGLESLHLPIDKRRPAIQTFNGSKIIVGIPAQLSDSLRRLAQSEGVTLYMLLLAAFDTLLYRYTGQEDLAVGALAANRNLGVLELLIGFFANSLVLRTALSGDIGFRELLSRVKKTTLDAYANQDFPFEKIVEELHPERDLSQNPLFQVLFSMQNIPNLSPSFAELDVRKVEIHNDFARFDLAVDLWETAPGLTAVFEYNSDLFLPDTVSRMAGHYQRLLEGIAADPAGQLNRYEIMTSAEKRTVLVEWNNTRIDFAAGHYWVRLFEANAAQNPGAIAVAAESGHLTYGELNRRANQLAHYLRSMLAKPEVVVGVYLDRSPLMTVGLLAIHKAGAAYLPLDPIFPKSRIEYMLEDAQAPLILTQTSLLETLPETKATLICLDAAEDVLAAQPDQNPELAVGPNQLAYLIYTSGSTGAPKGVQIEHAALANFLLSMKGLIRIGPGDRLLAVTTLSFDIAGLELFLPLVAGAATVIAGRDEVISGSALIAKLEQFDITYMQATPAAWRMLIEAGWPGKKNLRILCGGEALPLDLARELGKRVSKIWNVYGPTETTIWSTIAEIKLPLETVSIGSPLANTQIYILNEVRNPVPVGIPGELYIGGAGLARGYWRRPELTAEKFVRNPFALQVSNFAFPIIYRTGDLARWLPDGTIECLGRIDHQVKIRGYRIELGEIETVLNQHPAVEASVVAPKELRPGEASLIAYLIPKTGGLKFDELRAHLREKLPEYMIPAAFVQLAAFPTTPNGKIDRRALPLPENIKPQSQGQYIKPSNSMEETVSRIWQEVLKTGPIGVNDNFFDLGGHSLLLGQVQNKLQRILNLKLEMLDLFKYPTISALAKYLEQQTGTSTRENNNTNNTASLPKTGTPGVAVIGLAGRFPGASNIHEFWDNLCNGVESITRFSDAELLAAGVSPDLLDHPQFVKAWGALAGIEKFDAAFFGYNPNEAVVLDPQQRLFLEEAWHALENAGYVAEKYQGRIGVFAGAGMNTYLRNLQDSSGALADDYQVMISNDKDFLATRTAYKLNLEGPGITVQTACSTSLVAVHLACQSLMNGECDLALAGGVSIRLPQNSGYLYQEGMILSPDGHCRAFDRAARGTVGGNGIGVVVLKRLDDALADHDNIYAVIKGSAVNNDGAMKVGFTAPRVDGQAKVIAEAQARAGAGPETINYIEAHGTGTPLGDPIEIAALTQAFRAKTGQKSFCAIGSVKTNVGHLDAAAGVTGLIKTVLALYYRRIPPSLGFISPNPKIDFENSPFYVNTRLAEWPQNNGPRRAGVSSFGIGGTNAHVILEESPSAGAARFAEVAPTRDDSFNPIKSNHLLVFSAKTAAALEQITANFGRFLKENPDINIADAAYTLQIGRKEFNHRRMALVSSAPDAVAVLENKDPQRIFSAVCDQGDRKVVFMFPGQGAQYPDMGLGLYQEEPVFRETVDSCASLLKPHLGLDLRQALYPRGALTASPEPDSALLDRTAIAQPALFVVEYALAKLWQSWGITPQAMIGHSIGEYVAACLAGVFSLEEALVLVANRGKLMEQLPSGAMLAAPLAEPEICAYLNSELSLAAANGPLLQVVSGSLAAISELELKLQAKGIACRRLPVSHAFHSPMMDPVLAPFTELVRQIKLRKPGIPYISNVTGTWIREDEALNPEYWANHLRQTVRFGAGIQELLALPDHVFLEAGPGNTLGSLVKQSQVKKIPAVFSSMRNVDSQQPDEAFLKGALGRLWMAGVKIDWVQVNQGRSRSRRRIPLPGYPFEGKSYWISKPQPQKSRVHPAVKLNDISSWFYRPAWEQSTWQVLGLSNNLAVHHWLIFSEPNPFTDHLLEGIRAYGGTVTRVQAGTSFQEVTATHFVINPESAADYDRLLEMLQNNGRTPDAVINCWGITTGAEPPPSAAGTGAANRWFYSLLFLAQAFGKQTGVRPLKLKILSNNLHPVFGESALSPEKATLLGACKVIPQEYPAINCQSIDLALPGPGTAAESQLIDRIIAEFQLETPEPVVAYRGGNRWSLKYEPLKIEWDKPGSRTPAIPLKHGGIYLITGGLGGLGLILAGFLAREFQAKLVLVGRSVFPAPDQWPELVNRPESDSIIEKIKILQSCLDLGAKIMICQADVADLTQMTQVIRRVETEFGSVNGVFHAAGNPGGGMIQLRRPEFVEEVFRPKITGALTLHKLFSGRDLDFFIYCSSINAITGGFGQVDYSAANAFLDCFAQAHDNSRGTRYLSINWDRWPGVGMAGTGVSVPSAGRIGHPLLGKTLAVSHEKAVFASEFSPGQLWVLSEHLVSGIPTAPGTTYVEMIRAALAAMGIDGPIKINDLLFLQPLAAKPGEIREVYTIIQSQGPAYEIRIISRPRPEIGAETWWREHARGRITAVKPDLQDEDRLDLKALRQECNRKTLSFTPGQSQGESGFIHFGKRWSSLRRIDLGQSAALVEAELDGQFHTDLELYRLHPALLDVIAGSLRLIAGGNYLPFSYGEIMCLHPLPPRVYGYIRHFDWAASVQKPPEIITCDLELMDENGKYLVSIKNFAMKLVSELAAAEFKKRALAPGPADDARLGGLVSEWTGPQADLLREGITIAEGLEAWRRIFMGAYLPQIIVSTKELPSIIAQANQTGQAEIAAELAQTAIIKELQARPDLKTDYAPPKNEIEQRLAATWQEVLGIKNIGVHDDFFELGGNSLSLVQLHTKIKERFQTNLAAVDLYKYNTIASLAKNLTQDEEVKPVFVEVNQRANRQKEVLAQRRELKGLKRNDLQRR
ncbi:MAG: amino acid adenylation domain-containing protein [Firmicutes bacterium]|nr:amino acid adenylation domain-containing protein [Bacillota bacterium]